MPPNAIVITSTRSQEDYDINFAYVHHALDALQGAVDPIGSLFARRATRRFVYAGRASILAVLHLVWPLIKDGSMTSWQEFYVYQNSYHKDPPGTATIHTRHSFSPEQWFSAIVPHMVTGPNFYYTFWDFLIEPLYEVVSQSLNYMVYRPLRVQTHFVGVQEWLWPAFGELDKNTLSVLRGAVVRSWRSDYVPYKVPPMFLSILSSMTRHWHPRVRH